MANSQARQRELQTQAMQLAQVRQAEMSMQGSERLSPNTIRPNNPATSFSQPAHQKMSSSLRGSTMGSPLDDIPIQPSDMTLPQSTEHAAALESACRNGSMEQVLSLIGKGPITPRSLHPGLVATITAGRVEVARHLFAAGAVVSRALPQHVLSAPANQRIHLFALLNQLGWSPNTPGFYGEVLLPRVVTDLPLLRWFLAHGANPNLGEQLEHHDRLGASDTNSCRALEVAAARGGLEAVRLLLDAGARVENGLPLHRAAGVCPEGTNIYNDTICPTPEFDAGRVPIMELLVEKGADVNQRDESRYMVPRLPILLATMAGAVERVKWLLDHGADPEAEGSYGSAVSAAKHTGSEEMKRVIEEGVKARSQFATLPATSMDNIKAYSITRMSNHQPITASLESCGTMNHSNSNNYFDLPSDEEDDGTEAGYDSEAHEQSRGGRAAKRRKLSPKPTASGSEQDDDQEEDETEHFHDIAQDSVTAVTQQPQKRSSPPSQDPHDDEHATFNGPARSLPTSEKLKPRELKPLKSRDPHIPPPGSKPVSSPPYIPNTPNPDPHYPN
ncbi:MAG: hypothetical protein Q9162_001388 [Coniocarpon cinnabarinum]